MKLLNNVIWINHLTAFSIETSFYCMYLCTRYDSALWYLCHKTPLKTELKSPGIEFSLKFPHSWLAENLLITLYSWYHSWILNERFSCEQWFLWLRKKGVFFVSVCVCVCEVNSMNCFISRPRDFLFTPTTSRKSTCL